MATVGSMHRKSLGTGGREGFSDMPKSLRHSSKCYLKCLEGCLQGNCEGEYAFFQVHMDLLIACATYVQDVGIFVVT